HKLEPGAGLIRQWGGNRAPSSFTLRGGTTDYRQPLVGTVVLLPQATSAAGGRRRRPLSPPCGSARSIPQVLRRGPGAGFQFPPRPARSQAFIRSQAGKGWHKRRAGSTLKRPLEQLAHDCGMDELRCEGASPMSPYTCLRDPLYHYLVTPTCS